MNNIILIIGPSGVGKSSTVDKLNLPANYLVFHLDKVISEHNNESSISKYYSRIKNPAFLKKSIESICLLRNEFPDKNLVLDIGAGSIDYHNCVKYYSKFTKVYLCADKQTIYKRLMRRNPDENRSLNVYLKSEYSPHRISLYKSAILSIDNSKLSIEQAAQKLENFILTFSTKTDT